MENKKYIGKHFTMNQFIIVSFCAFLITMMGQAVNDTLGLLGTFAMALLCIGLLLDVMENEQDRPQRTN